MYIVTRAAPLYAAPSHAKNNDLYSIRLLAPLLQVERRDELFKERTLERRLAAIHVLETLGSPSLCR